MFCDECGSPLNEQGICPVCGWSNNPNKNPSGTSSGALNPQIEPVDVSVFNSTPQGQAPQQIPKQQPANPNVGKNIQQPTGQNPVPAQNQMYSQNQIPAQNQMYMQDQMPTPNQMYMQNQMPTPNQMYMQNQTSAQNQMHMQNQMPAQNQMYMQNQMPAQNQMYMQNQMSAQNQMHMQGQASKKSEKKKWPIIVAVSVLGVALVVGLVLIFGKDKVRDYTSTERTTEQTTEHTSETTEASSQTTTEHSIQAESGSKTIMIYMVGADLESEYEAASSDINEILNSGYDESGTTVLIHTGGCTDWDMSEIPDRANATFVVQNGALEMLSEEDAKNMGDSDTLTDFLTYGYENYPAEQFGLILWNHGGGAFFGYGYDEITEDSLMLQELKTAFDQSPFATTPLEFIGFDACLMGNIETAHVLSPYAHYLIASQEPEPSWGWDYSFLEDIDSMSDGAEIGTEIVDDFISTTEDNFAANPFSYSNITLSVVDLTQIAPVEEALSNLFSKASGDLSQNSFSQFSKIRTTTKEIAADFSYSETSYDVIDLVDLAKRMNSQYPSEASALATALSNYIVYSDANEENANGVSIYHPYYAKDFAEQKLLAIYKTFDFAQGYTDYITSFTSLLTGAETFDVAWDPNELQPVANGDMSFSVNLSDEQVSCLQNAYYVISRADMEQEGNYVCVALSNDVSVDGLNTATANFDGNIIYIQNDTTGETYEVMYQVQETTETYTRYLLTSILYNEDIEEADAMYAYFVMEVSAEHPEGEILGAYPIANYVNSDGTELFPERYEIDLNDYKYIAFGNLSHYFTSDEDLTEFNEADWSDLTINYNSFPISEGFSTVSGGLQSGIPYFGMFVFEDAQGNRHSSSLVQLQ